MQKYLLILVVLAVLTACTAPSATPTLPLASPTKEISPTLPPPTATQEPTQTPLPASTATPMPTATNAAVTGTEIGAGNLSILTFKAVEQKLVVSELGWETADKGWILSEGRMYRFYTDPLTVEDTPISDATNIRSLAPMGRFYLRQPGSGGLVLGDLVLGDEKVVSQTGMISGARLSQDGQAIILYSADEIRVELRNTEDLQTAATLSGFETAGPVFGGALAPGGAYFAWIARATLQFQEVASGEMGEPYRFEDFIGAYTFNPEGSQLAFSTGQRLQVVPVGLQTAEEPLILGTGSLEEPYTALAFTPDGKLLAATKGEEIEFWSTADWKKAGTLSAEGKLRFLQFSPDGRLLVSQDEDLRFTVWSVP